MSKSNIDRDVPQGAPAMTMANTQNMPVPLSMGEKSESKLHLQAHNTVTKRKVKRKGGGGPLANIASWLLDNQIAFPFTLLALLFLAHFCVPMAQPYTSRVFLPSHYNPNTGQYAVGGDDFLLLGFYVVLYTGLRASFMKYILAPLAQRWGISKKKDIVRFSEQAYLLCYYSVFWTLGLYLYCTSTYYLNLRELFTNWPTRELPGITKAYILGQWAFWLQQIIVINIEKRRKDHWQMFSHHIVTVVLISTSYAMHLTRVANLILVLMDIVDIFFPLAKCLKYLGYATLCDIMFGFFMVSWFVARHVFYVITMWSIKTDMAEIIPIGCYHGSQDNLIGPTPLPEHNWSHMLEPFINPTGTICYSDNVRWGFLSALGFLQILTIVWFFMIVQVAIRVIKGVGADDIRSDDEAEEEEEEADEDEDDVEYIEHVEYGEAQALEVGAEAIDFQGWKRRANVKGAASSSGVSITRRSDRKELLNRIGCEKQVD